MSLLYVPRNTVRGPSPLLFNNFNGDPMIKSPRGPRPPKGVECEIMMLQL